MTFVFEPGDRVRVVASRYVPSRRYLKDVCPLHPHDHETPPSVDFPAFEGVVVRRFVTDTNLVAYDVADDQGNEWFRLPDELSAV